MVKEARIHDDYTDYIVEVEEALNPRRRRARANMESIVAYPRHPNPSVQGADAQSAVPVSNSYSGLKKSLGKTGRTFIGGLTGAGVGFVTSGPLGAVALGAAGTYICAPNKIRKGFEGLAKGGYVLGRGVIREGRNIGKDAAKGLWTVIKESAKGIDKYLDKRYARNNSAGANGGNPNPVNPPINNPSNQPAANQANSGTARAGFFRRAYNSTKNYASKPFRWFRDQIVLTPTGGRGTEQPANSISNDAVEQELFNSEDYALNPINPNSVESIIPGSYSPENLRKTAELPAPEKTPGTMGVNGGVPYQKKIDEILKLVFGDPESAPKGNYGKMPKAVSLRNYIGDNEMFGEEAMRKYNEFLKSDNPEVKGLVSRISDRLYRASPGENSDSERNLYTAQKSLANFLRNRGVNNAESLHSYIAADASKRNSGNDVRNWEDAVGSIAEEVMID